MTKAIALAYEVIHRLTLGHGTEHVELALIAVGQEHRTGIGVGSKHVAQTIFFLVGAVVGKVTSDLYVPLIQTAYSTAGQMIPLSMVSSQEDIIKLYIVVGVVIVIALIILARLVQKIKIAQALKLGED